MTTRTPVEVSTRYATTVDDLPAAWAFVVDKLESVGPDPSVTISPVWPYRCGDHWHVGHKPGTRSDGLEGKIRRSLRSGR